MVFNLNNIELSVLSAENKEWPKDKRPEIVFAGKSNVGKSSLINLLLNRKKIAYVGKIPGKTRTINFYDIDNKIYFVDLPGYGYAKHTKGKEEEWSEFVNDYLTTRKEISLIIHLVDSRHNPTEDDIMMNNWVKYSGIPYIVCLTKTDKLKSSQKAKKINNILKKMQETKDNIILTSTLKKMGKDKLWGVIKKSIDQ